MCIIGMLIHSLTINNRKTSLTKLRMAGGTTQSITSSSLVHNLPLTINSC